MTAPSQKKSPIKTTIAIIGGGFSGTAVAYHLAGKTRPGTAEILVFEPRSEIGKGLAYDTADPSHRINVPAARMSLLPAEPEHFLQWLGTTDALAGDPEAVRPDGGVFPSRGVFGAYVHSCLRPFLENGSVRHLHAAVQSVVKEGTGWRITDDKGGMVFADILVIATTHPSPRPPARLAAALAGHPRFVPDPTKPHALDVVADDDRVLIVGNGLTSADIIASLHHQGHRGTILALSRRGLRSRGHAPFAQEPFGDFLSPPPERASALLARVRSTIRAAGKEGLTWHAVIDQVRAQGGEIWKRIPLAERQRIVRHLRAFWDVHRFRIAPQVETVLDDAIAAGRLQIIAASIIEAKTDGGPIDVTIKARGRADPTRHRFDALIVTTGPAHGDILVSQDWLRHLAGNGHLHLDPTGLGLACNERSEALSADLTSDPTLFISGPLARGQFGELMGLPQVSEHAVFIADRIMERMNETG